MASTSTGRSAKANAVAATGSPSPHGYEKSGNGCGTRRRPERTGDSRYLPARFMPSISFSLRVTAMRVRHRSTFRWCEPSHAGHVIYARSTMCPSLAGEQRWSAAMGNELWGRKRCGVSEDVSIAQIVTAVTTVFYAAVFAIGYYLIVRGNRKTLMEMREDDSPAGDRKSSSRWACSICPM